MNTYQEKRKAILLIQFGSPDAPTYGKVSSFISEVLHDNLFSSFPSWIRSLLIRLMLHPWLSSAACLRYKKIWSKNASAQKVEAENSFNPSENPNSPQLFEHLPEMSPLLLHTNSFYKKLTALISRQVRMALGMLYGRPTLSEALSSLRAFEPETVLIVPLFPHRTSMTAKALMSSYELIRLWPHTPSIKCIDSFAEKDFFLDSWTQKIRAAQPWEYDHVLFSFHGLPKRNIPYKNACADTAETIAKKASLPSFSFAFQSKVGIGKWLVPSTKSELLRLTQQGKKRVLVVPASFVADCSETLYEIGYKYKNFFHRIGGQELQLLPCLNDDDVWVKEARHFLNENLFS